MACATKCPNLQEIRHRLHSFVFKMTYLYTQFDVIPY